MSAVKVMNLDIVAKAGMQEKYLNREIKALIAIRHPNVLKVNDIFKANKHLYIFMEFAPNGTLKDKVKKAANRRLTERVARRWFKQCVEALHCMHVEHHMAHRDIKLDNVLFDASDNAKLSDFGFAREFSLEGSLSKTFCGTVPYYAPEIIRKKPYNPFLYDVWSMGVMLFTMLNGKLPFDVSGIKRSGGRQEILEQMRDKNYSYQPEVEDELSSEVKELIDCMFTFNPDDRPNIIGVRNHPWLSGSSARSPRARTP